MRFLIPLAVFAVMVIFLGIGLTLARDAAISTYENKARDELPWLSKGVVEA